MPNVSPSTRSSAVGEPPRKRWPSTTDRDSNPVSLCSSAATRSPTPPSTSARPTSRLFTVTSPPAGNAPSATTTIEYLRELRSRNTVADLAFHAFRDLESCDWRPFVKAAVERIREMVQNVE